MAFTVVRKFENEIARYSGAPYAVSIMNATCAIFLCCLYRAVEEVTIPAYTYPGVASSIKNVGGTIKFSQDKWQGIYELAPYKIIDSALRFKRGMYIPNTLYCLSFAMKKSLPIGRGGMILTDDRGAYEWLKKARFDGRTEGVPIAEDNYTMLGWNMYMSPEQAARGLWIFDSLKNKDIPDIDPETQGYPDLSKFPIFQ